MPEMTTAKYAAGRGISARTVRRHAAAGKLAARWDGRRYLISAGDPLDGLAPGGAAWLGLMSASKVAAVLGVSTFTSQYALWHEMKGLAPREAETKVQARGHYLEDGVIAWWLDQHPEAGQLDKQHTRRMGDWALATLDALVVAMRAGLEVKTWGSWDEWGEQGTDEVPAPCYAQALWQMACCPELERVYFAVLGPRLDFREYVVERDDALIASVVRRCREFYDSLAADVAPDLDGHKATLAVLKRMHPDIEEKAEAVITDALAIEYVTADLAYKAAEDAKRAAQSKVLAEVGTANYVHTAGGLKVARRQPNRTGISLVCVAKTVPTPVLEVAA